MALEQVHAFYQKVASDFIGSFRGPIMLYGGPANRDLL